MISTELLELHPVPPYDFDLSMSIFSGGDPQIRKYENGKFWQLVRFNSRLVLVTAENTGPVLAPSLSVTLISHGKIPTDENAGLKKTIYHLFHLGLDLKLFYDAVSGDHVLRSITGKLKGLKYPRTGSVYEAVISAITEQQISSAVARSMQVKLVKKFGDSLLADGQSYFAFPLPAKLADATIPELRACGLSQNKAEYIKDISIKVASWELDLEKFHRSKSADRIISELMQVRGLGRWTAEYVLIRGLTRTDVLPADDVAIRKSVAHYYFKDAKIDAQAVRSLADGWGKWKGLAAFYLMRASRFGIEVD